MKPLTPEQKASRKAMRKHNKTHEEFMETLQKRSA